VNAIWRLFVVLTEQFFDFLGRLERLAFYIPQFSINVVTKFPGILAGALDLSLLGISALVLESPGANWLKALAQLDRSPLTPLSYNFTWCDSR
jgi:hypothetical protein